MERDLRETALYKDTEEHFTLALSPGFGKISDADDPQSSPDGRQIAFSGLILEKLEGSEGSRICLADVESGGFRQVTGGEHDHQPRWSPDGGRLSFASDRKEKGRAQLYVLDAGGLGEATPLPEVEGTVEDHAWSLDGTRILVLAAGLHADAAGAEGSGAHEADKDLPDWVPKVDSWDDEQVWRRLWLIDTAAGEATRLVAGDLNFWEIDWLGNGAVVGIASKDPGESAWYGAALVRVDLDTGEATELLRSDVQLGMPRGAPGGDSVAVIEAPCSDRQLLAGRIVLVNGDKAHRVGVPQTDVTWIGWRDGSTLGFGGIRATESVFGDLEADSGSAKVAWSSPEAAGGWAPSGATNGADGFAVVRQSFDLPPELAVVDPTGARTIASFAHEGHEYLRKLVGRAELTSWGSRDGLEIQGFLLTPDGEGPHPLILLVHGGPVWSYQAWFPRVSTAFLISRGYAVLMPNPRGSTGRGREFIEAVIGDMGGEDAHDDLAGIDAMVDLGIADPDRIGVTGGSYGGFMSCWLPVVDQRFKASVAISPVTDFTSQHFNSNIGDWDAWFLGGRPEEGTAQYRDRSPVMFADRVVTPTLLTAGTEDRCTPPGQAIEFYRALLARGVPTEVVVYPGEGHGVRKLPAAIDLVARSAAWFERFMPARKDT